MFTDSNSIINILEMLKKFLLEHKGWLLFLSVYFMRKPWLSLGCERGSSRMIPVFLVYRNHSLAQYFCLSIALILLWFIILVSSHDSEVDIIISLLRMRKCHNQNQKESRGFFRSQKAFSLNAEGLLLCFVIFVCELNIYHRYLPMEEIFKQILILFHFVLFACVGLSAWHVESYFRHQRSNPYPLHWKHRALTTAREVPGKSSKNPFILTDDKAAWN